MMQYVVNFTGKNSEKGTDFFPNIFCSVVDWAYGIASCLLYLTLTLKYTVQEGYSGLK